MPQVKIAFCGDSILKGIVHNASEDSYQLKESEGFQALCDGLGFRLWNQSKFGCTIAKGKRVVERLLGREKDIRLVLLEYGGNDCDFNWPEVAAAPALPHRPNTCLESFETQFTELLNFLKAKAIIPMMMNLPPIDGQKYYETIVRRGADAKTLLAWLGDTQMIYRFQELYSRKVEAIAQATGTFLIDVRSRFLAQRDYLSLICADGIHPNAKGHVLLREAMEEAFRSKAFERLTEGIC